MSTSLTNNAHDARFFQSADVDSTQGLLHHSINEIVV